MSDSSSLRPNARSRFAEALANLSGSSDMTPRKLVVVGQGYVGLPLSARAVEVGFDVVGVDVDADRIGRLAGGDTYVEDVTAGAVQKMLDSGRYRPTTDIKAAADFDVAVITVPTPLREGSPDLTYVEQAGRSLAPLLQAGATVVLESTTYPGTTEQLLQPILEQGSGLRAEADFFLGYSPERIDPGNPVYGLVNTPKVISGIGPASLAAVKAFFDDIVDTTVLVRTPKEAELTKLLENTFRHVNIALVNELAMFARELDIDIWEVIDAAATKPFGFMPFRPGPGVGGHCLPIDPSYLSWQVKRSLGRSFRFVELANDINEHMPDYVVRRVMLALNDRAKPVHGARLLLLGLAYKRNTGDARESPAGRVAELLVQLGAQVRVADPHVLDGFGPAGITRVNLTRDEVESADGIVLLTDHDAFELGLLNRAGCVVVDTRHKLSDRPNVVRL